MTRSDGPRLMRVTSRDGTEIASWTGGTGVPLVLVHGTASLHATWDRLRPSLEPRATVHAVDRRGRGASGDSPSTMSPASSRTSPRWWTRPPRAPGGGRPAGPLLRGTLRPRRGILRDNDDLQAAKRNPEEARSGADRHGQAHVLRDGGKHYVARKS